MVLFSFHIFDTKENGVSPGMVEQYLYHYYLRRKKKKRRTREGAIQLLWLLRCHYSSNRTLLESRLRKKGILRVELDRLAQDRS
jgi:hypothetical protein